MRATFAININHVVLRMAPAEHRRPAALDIVVWLARAVLVKARLHPSNNWGRSERRKEAQQAGWTE